MDYRTYKPHPDLESLVKCHWTLEVPSGNDSEKQRIIPDGCIEMAFILGEDIKRYTSETDFILQPRAMVLGQTLEPFYIQPTGYVNTFAVRFYPYGFANFVSAPIDDLANKETPLARLFGENDANELEQKIIHSGSTPQRIEAVEGFLLKKLTEKRTIDGIVKTTVDAILSTHGGESIKALLKGDLSKRRQLERKFSRQIGISPKQLGKVVRLQAALKMLLSRKTETLTRIAYESEYYDQAHFIKDFKEFTGVNPKKILDDRQTALSKIFYSED